MTTVHFTRRVIHGIAQTLCRQNVGLLNVKLVVHIVTTKLFVKNVKRKGVPVEDMKAHWGSASTSALILNLRTRWLSN